MAKFYFCETCGNIVETIVDAGGDPTECREPMKELVPNTSEGATEKHIPEVCIDGDRVCVQVGSTEHPMLDEHHIVWIYLETENGGQKKMLHPGDEPRAEFLLKDDKPVAVYEYCNIHGLWKKEL